MAQNVTKNVVISAWVSYETVNKPHEISSICLSFEASVRFLCGECLMFGLGSHSLREEPGKGEDHHIAYYRVCSENSESAYNLEALKNNGNPGMILACG